MKATSFHLVIALALSFSLITSNAVPSSRLKGLSSQENQGISSISDAREAITDDALIEELLIKGRMDIATNDYPPSGANNHHTPKPPGNF
ncbi:hypothetical protein LUZ61_009469 [Rhynchospora tenuis]|uniref:Uncharacterized protein n=1 Tax=Rhynchospora tenuis TaxID=198213 RepID=A0AAD5ZXL4_9POAL|nr:hypothetical protein LUZ61_009469 [Rhynchospora tenuis]